MKRSRAVHLIVIASAAAAIESCGAPPPRHCIDGNNVVIDERICENPDQYPPSHGYHWYYGGSSGSAPVGSRVFGGSSSAPGESAGTVTGVFGGAGDAASGGGHGSGGEGAGE